jgi:DNA-binding transcriptional LysR family regulator
MSATPTHALLGILDQYQPKRLLCISRGSVPAVTAYVTKHPDCELVTTSEAPLPDDLANQRYDLAIVADQLEQLSKREGTELLAGLRNLSVSRMAVLVELAEAPQWETSDFYGLAMQREAHFERDERCLTLFTYDLAEYKTVPDWLNSKYWANPENFDKYWW